MCSVLPDSLLTQRTVPRCRRRRYRRRWRPLVHPMRPVTKRDRGTPSDDAPIRVPPSPSAPRARNDVGSAPATGYHRAASSQRASDARRPDLATVARVTTPFRGPARRTRRVRDAPRGGLGIRAGGHVRLAPALAAARRERAALVGHLPGDRILDRSPAAQVQREPEQAPLPADADGARPVLVPHLVGHDRRRARARASSPRRRPA